MPHIRDNCGMPCRPTQAYLPCPFPAAPEATHVPPGIISNIHLRSIQAAIINHQPVQNWRFLTTRYFIIPRNGHRSRRYLIHEPDVSLLYIKQLHTPPGVSYCQPPKINTNIAKTRTYQYAQAFLCVVPRTLFENALALSLFVLRILADYPDTSFSLDNLAFFTDWFY